MMEEIDQSDDGLGNAVRESRRDMLYSILGGPLEGLNESQEEKLILITLNYVHKVYNLISKTKIRVG